MKKKLLIGGVAVLTAAMVIGSAWEWLDIAALPVVALIALGTAAAVGLLLAWVFRRGEEIPRRPDAPAHPCQPVLRYEGLSLSLVCPECGKSWALRSGWRLLGEIGAVLLTVWLRAEMIPLYSNALYFGEYQAETMALAMGLTLLGFCAASFLLNGLLYLCLRGRNPERLRGNEYAEWQI